MGETVDARPLLQRHASAPLIHCHAVDAGATDDPAERLTVIECLEELHYNEVAVLKTELGGRINKLSSLRLKLEEESAEQQAAIKHAENREKSRKSSALKRAYLRDMEIAFLRHELEYQQQINSTLEKWGEEAQEALKMMQERVFSISFISLMICIAKRSKLPTRLVLLRGSTQHCPRRM
ncbi:hypothetical protein D8B26_002475 [Coccidioides posadasii str. Silveira]|uniref:Uncharacterized protein n=1 Tax=Coccidioides posadasii (strain RMSCC 757 / Silveira) TaxID=443226 RepID=E9DHC8_COCPS|nr:hypothetical protein CPSG_09227 [Coccidioides posadasii str. Silveira]QVM07784.1 hypothetical protein D8B26_002475 [Coccidioides posadasii str. Silveira]